MSESEMVPNQPDEVDSSQSAQIEAVEEAVQVSEGLDSKVERLAREQGWNPQEDFNGNPSDWVDAAEYLARGSDFRRREAFKYKDEIESLKDTMAKFQDHLGKTEKAMYEKAKLEIEQEIAKARSVGDFDRYEQAQKAKQDLDNKIPLADLEDKTVVDRFKSEHPWYESPKNESEEELQAMALAFEKIYIAKNPSFKLKDLAEHLSAKMAKEVSRRMVNENRTSAPPAASVGSKAKVEAKPSGNLPHPKFNKLSDSQKEAFSQFKKYIPNFDAGTYIESLEKSGQLK